MFKLFSNSTIILPVVGAAIACAHEGAYWNSKEIASSKDSYKALSALSVTDAPKIKVHFCNGDKPKRSISNRLKIAIPKIDSSVPLDEAQNIRAEYTKIARRLASNFYVLASYSDTQTTWSFDYNQAKDYQFLRAREAGHSSNCNYQISEHTESHYSQLKPISSVSQLDFLFEHDVSSNVIWIAIDGEIDNQTYCYNRSRPKQLEASLLVDSFTLLMPGMNISDAVSKRYELMADYFSGNTHLSESPNKNPSFINMQITLDLAKFCAYGRAISDLTAK